MNPLDLSPNRMLPQLILVSIAFTVGSVALPQEQRASGDSTQQVIGTIERATDRTIEVKPDSGASTGRTVIIQDSTVLQKVPYGGSPKDARTITLVEVHAGDRILARGKTGQDAGTIIADRVLVVEQTDLVQGQQRDRDDWQKRGVAGVVIAMDKSGNDITISRSGNKTVITITASTKILRYTDTGKFKDAKSSTLEQIAIGDLLRARGDRETKRNSVVAEEVVFGSCRSDNPDCHQ